MLFFRRSILLLVFYFYIHGYQRVWRCQIVSSFGKGLCCVVVERRKHITPEKRAGHQIATLAVGIAGSKGRASDQGSEAGGGTFRGKTLETGRRKRKRGG